MWLQIFSAISDGPHAHNAAIEEQSEHHRKQLLCMMFALHESWRRHLDVWSPISIDAGATCLGDLMCSVECDCDVMISRDSEAYFSHWGCYVCCRTIGNYEGHDDRSWSAGVHCTCVSRWGHYLRCTLHHEALGTTRGLDTIVHPHMDNVKADTL